MRYSASERAEIIRLVEQSHLPAKRTLDYGTGNIPETPGFLISGSGPEADFVPRPGHVNFSSESRLYPDIASCSLGAKLRHRRAHDANSSSFASLLFGDPAVLRQSPHNSRRGPRRGRRRSFLDIYPPELEYPHHALTHRPFPTKNLIDVISIEAGNPCEC